MKSNKLTNIKVHFISLVREGANKREVIWKSEKGPDADFTGNLKLTKSDDEKRIVYGTVYVPGELDTQGDWATAEDIEAASHEFLKTVAQHHVDLEHDFSPVDGVYVAESWVLRGKDPMIKDGVPGSWVIAIKVLDDPTWESIKSGNLQAISMAGTAKREEGVPVHKGEGGTGDQPLLAKIFNFLKTRDARETDEMDTKELKKALDEAIQPLNDRIAVIEKAQKPESDTGATDITKALESALKPLADRLENIEKASKGSKQSEEKAGDETANMLKRMAGEE